MAASLAPVYQKLEVYDEREIELEEVSTHEPFPKNEETVSLTPKDDTCTKSKLEEDEETPKTKTNVKRIAKCCRCAMATTCLLITITVLVLALISGVVAFKVRQCVLPQHHETQEFHYAPSDIDRLSISIPTGMISVHSCSLAKNVTVKITIGAKSGDLIKQIHVDGGLLSQRTATITVTSPSFDFQNCQIARVEVIVPSSSNRSISMSASAMAGYIRMNTNNYMFNGVDLLVNAGVIRATHVQSKDIKAHADFGGVVGRDLKSEGNLTLNSKTGGMCVFRAAAKHAAFHVGTGYFKLRESTVSERLSTCIGMGVGSLMDISAPAIVGDISYGNLLVTPNVKFNGDFKLKSAHGHVEVTTPPMGQEPTLTSKSETLLAGHATHGLAGESLSHVELESKNGNIRLHLLNP